MPSQRDAFHRHATHYHSVLQQAQALHQKGGRTIRQGLALFDREWLNIAHGFGRCAENMVDDSVAAQLCSDYPLAGFELLRLRQPPRERIIWHERGFAAARQLHAVGSMFAHVGNMTVAFTDIGESERALSYSATILEIARLTGDRQIEMHALGNIGIACTLAAQPDRALAYHQHQLELARTEGSPHEELRALGGFGHAYKQLNNLEGAQHYFQQALVRSRKLRNRALEASTLCDLGLTYAEMGKRSRAMWFYLRARTIARSIGHQHLETTVNWNMGLLYARKGALDRAIALMEPLVHRERTMEHVNAGVSTDRLSQLEQVKLQTPTQSWLARVINSVRRWWRVEQEI